MAEAAKKPVPSPIQQRPMGDNPSAPTVEAMTPTEIVAELDRYIIGQKDAKRAVAVALRNRYRRQLLSEELRKEIQPKNILMIGPTGVGKTEIARRVARIVEAPFIKVEATKFTEVGYVGRDVESIIRDLVEVAISMLHGQRLEQVKDAASTIATQRLVEILVQQFLDKKPAPNGSKDDTDLAKVQRQEAATQRRMQRERKRLLQLLDEKALEEETVEIEIETEPGYYEDYNPLDDTGEAGGGVEYRDVVQEFLDSVMPRRRMRRRVPVREARRILIQQEADRMVDFDAVIDEAIRRVEDGAVVFIDEIDKTVRSDSDYGNDVSGEGVQRDLLPIVEGSVVMTRYGPVRTDHILFIAAGAFHRAKPSDLIPELQGRFPIRVELSSLSESDLYAILTEPQNALTKQYQALLGTEGVDLQFSEDGLREMARLATLVNSRTEDIGARRLQTILEKVVEELSFDAPAESGKTVTIDRTFVDARVGNVAADDDLSNFIL